MNAITIPSLLAFLSYLGIGIAVLAAAIAAVTLVTPHRDIALIRQGNVSAAVAFGGALIGLALPLHSAISHSVSLIDAAIWGAIAAVAQLLAFVVANIVGGDLSKKIAEKDLAAGILSSTVSIAVGLINAAAMTP